jgi:glucosamine 6-phosphate synthetase-like amidotransferase/phosphosugar isomerase protein
MCDIIGILGKQAAVPLLVEGLKRLAYRGYDSAGVATLVNGHIDRRRAEGKLANLEAALARSPLPGMVGIGHTRWATPWAAQRDQCPSPCHRPRRHRPQRHHRELPGAARRVDRKKRRPGAVKSS